MIVPLVKRYFPHLVALAALIVLITVTGLLWMERANRFPLPNIGAYFGKITGIDAPGEESSLMLYAERTSDEPKFMVALVKPGWEPRVIAASEQGGAPENSTLPVILRGSSGQLRLRGSKTGPDTYTGVAEDLTSGKKGSWTLSLIGSRGSTAAENNTEQIKLWLKLKEELIDTESQISENERRIPEIQGEVDKLTNLVTAKDRLKGLGDEKYQVIHDEVVKMQAKLKALQEQARILQDKLLLAQRVTPMGRLVFMSRESLEREGRWIDSMYRSGAKDQAPELEEAVQKGEQILRIKKEIEAERDRISVLRGGLGL